MEFINEGDMEELFEKLDNSEIHYAAEVRMFQILIPWEHLVPL
jgi:hypothetical protein